MPLVIATARARRPAGLELVIERGDESYVAKEEASVYEGWATRRWLKVKQKDWADAEDRWQRRIFWEDRR